MAPPEILMRAATLDGRPRGQDCSGYFPGVAAWGCIWGVRLHIAHGPELAGRPVVSHRDCPLVTLSSCTESAGDLGFLARCAYLSVLITSGS